MCNMFCLFVYTKILKYNTSARFTYIRFFNLNLELILQEYVLMFNQNTAKISLEPGSPDMSRDTPGRV